MNFGLGQDIQYPRAENDTESMAFVKTKRLVIDKNNSQNRLRRELCVKLGEKKRQKRGIGGVAERGRMREAPKERVWIQGRQSLLTGSRAVRARGNGSSLSILVILRNPCTRIEPGRPTVRCLQCQVQVMIVFFYRLGCGNRVINSWVRDAAATQVSRRPFDFGV